MSFIPLAHAPRHCTSVRQAAAAVRGAAALVLVSSVGFLAPASLRALPTGEGPASDSLVPVTVRFRAMVDAADFACGTRYQNIGRSQASITASEFRFYVHDLRLINSAGDTVSAALRAESPWQDTDVALLDFENGTATCSNGTPETRDAVVVMAPPGEYRGLVFTLGVPFARNHANVSEAPPPLSVSRLFWSWNGGYKFLRIDMRATAGDSAPTPWVLHLGSVGCTARDGEKVPTSCSRPNRATVSLPDFDPAHDVVIADLAALLAGSDVRRNQPKTAAGCMSADADEDCGGLFAALGLSHPAATSTNVRPFFRRGADAVTRVGVRRE
jgi:uncharacterized repeat protein (TIGR04052 family)